jgi:ABC-type sulfate/molybdate transport systems ATPase subunit
MLLATAAIAATEAPLLLLDEPTRGLDPGSKERLVRFLRSRAADGYPTVLATHDVELAAAVATRVVMLAGGEVIADGTPAIVLGDSHVFAPQMTRVFGPGWRTPEQVARETAWPDVGVSPEVDRVAFALDVGAISDPIATDRGAVILRVVEHRRPTQEELNADRETLRTELVNEARNRFFSAHMSRAKQKMAITVSRENLQKVIG